MTDFDRVRPVTYGGDPLDWDREFALAELARAEKAVADRLALRREPMLRGLYLWP